MLFVQYKLSWPWFILVTSVFLSPFQWIQLFLWEHLLLCIALLTLMLELSVILTVNHQYVIMLSQILPSQPFHRIMHSLMNQGYSPWGCTSWFCHNVPGSHSYFSCVGGKVIIASTYFNLELYSKHTVHTMNSRFRLVGIDMVFLRWRIYLVSHRNLSALRLPFSGTICPSKTATVTIQWNLCGCKCILID